MSNSIYRESGVNLLIFRNNFEYLSKIQNWLTLRGVRLRTGKRCPKFCQHQFFICRPLFVLALNENTEFFIKKYTGLGICSFAFLLFTLLLKIALLKEWLWANHTFSLKNERFARKKSFFHHVFGCFFYCFSHFYVQERIVPITLF